MTKFKANNRTIILCFNKDHGCFWTFCPTNRLNFFAWLATYLRYWGRIYLACGVPFQFFPWESRKAAAWWEHCIMSFSSYNRYELSSLLTCFQWGFIAQLVEHRTGIVKVMSSNPVVASDFFLGFLCNCLSCFTTYRSRDHKIQMSVTPDKICPDFWVKA